ncbi:MAG: hypothetical protein HYV09_06780 [Deltaproteobacteria bacterium]|nr:hypothetical protein [Deltaproteobacteria bacterium]
MSPRTSSATPAEPVRDSIEQVEEAPVRAHLTLASEGAADVLAALVGRPSKPSRGLVKLVKLVRKHRAAR